MTGLYNCSGEIDVYSYHCRDFIKEILYDLIQEHSTFKRLYKINRNHIRSCSSILKHILKTYKYDFDDDNLYNMCQAWVDILLPYLDNDVLYERYITKTFIFIYNKPGIERRRFLSMIY